MQPPTPYHPCSMCRPSPPIHISIYSRGFSSAPFPLSLPRPVGHTGDFSSQTKCVFVADLSSHIATSRLLSFHLLSFRSVLLLVPLLLFAFILLFDYEYCDVFHRKSQKHRPWLTHCAWLEVHKEFSLNFQFSQNSFNENMVPYI